jgi:hypothetical protein
MQILAPHEQEKFDEFFALYADASGAYEHANFSFVAVAGLDGPMLAQGHIILPIGDTVPQGFKVTTPSILGCSVRLSELATDCRGLIAALLGDGLETPVGKVVLGPNEPGSNSVSAHFAKYPQNFYTPIVHPLRLTLSSGSHVFANRQAEFQSDLRANVFPYDSISELASELNLYPLRWDVCSLDVTAHAAVAVDFNGRVQDGSARLAIRVAKGVDIKHARLGYRVQSADAKTVERRSLDSSELNWADDGEFVQVGEIQVTVPPSTIVQCFASYKGRWVHQGWIADPDTAVNLRRAAHEVFDPNLEGTRKSLFDAKLLKQDARTLEAGVGNLLFMHGFAVNPLSSHFTAEAADLLAFTPLGHVAVVECTVGAIDNKGKLSKLLARSGALVEKLKQTGNPHLKVLPVMVTTLPRAALADIDLASAKGVLVVSLEDLQRWLEETLVPRDANHAFEGLWTSVNPPQDELFPTR